MIRKKISQYNAPITLCCILEIVLDSLTSRKSLVKRQLKYILI